MKSFIFLLCLIGSAMVVAQSQPFNPNGDKMPTIEDEVILGVITDDEGIEYQVNSGGCTDKDSFRIDIRESYPPQIILTRVERDFCEAYIRNGIRVKFTWKEIGINPGAFIISNIIGRN